MYVFRSGRHIVRGEKLLRGLRCVVSHLSSYPSPPVTGGRLADSGCCELIDALLRAGEVECALADAEWDHQQVAVAGTITDMIAECLVQQSLESCPKASRALASLNVPERLCISAPEGFAYYGLHPLDYASLASDLCEATSGELGHRPARAAVVGIRSIGTTLSAVVAAALRSRGLVVERATVRPEGHPFDRRCRWNECQLRWIRSQLESSAQFFVVDEGPGLSGSSFLSVAEALVAAGVAKTAITLLCGHAPDLPRLQAPDAQRRWSNLRSFAVDSGKRRPGDCAEWIGAGAWRSFSLPPEAPGEIEWPASWIQMERAKYLTVDGRGIYKFEGLGRYGKEVARRSEQLAEAGLSPRVLRPFDGLGYVCYERTEGLSLGGRQSSRVVRSEEALGRLARYCALRVTEFACDPSVAASEEIRLDTMCEVNIRKEFGVDLDFSADLVPCERPVIADGRMMPHEWMLTPSGNLLKSDGASHGDDHFFPGPCDIAWDLAGVVTEWNLGADATDFFLEAYRRASGDNIRPRLDGYLAAYALFRMGYSKMASEAMQGSSEEKRLRRAFAFYREAAETHLFHALRFATRKPFDKLRAGCAAARNYDSLTT
jgi:hypothetical protein